MYKTDYHIHTYYSDGRSSIEDYLRYAEEIGIDEIGFSDHISFDKSVKSISIEHELARKYIDEITELRNKYSSLKVKIGFEVNYTVVTECVIGKFFEGLPVDYLIGSIHNLPYGSVDHNPEFYKERNVEKIWSDYFNLVEKAIKSNLFNIIGHIDLVRIFNMYPKTDVSCFYKHIAKVLSVEGVAVELNTNGINKHLNSIYPSPRFLNFFYERGVAICVNSDAHKKESLCQYFDLAYDILREIGYKNMVVFENRDIKKIDF